MRITNSMMVTNSLRDLNLSLGRLQKTQTQLSTGRQITKASDDPTGTATAMGLRKQLNRADHYSRSLEDAHGWLNTADATLTSGLDLLAKAKEITVAASNSGGISDPNARVAMSIELRSIRTQMLSLANTTYGNRSIFNGTASGAAYSSTGTYLGNTGSVVRDVAAQDSMAINLTGTQIFGTAGGAVGDMFEVLDRLATAVLAGNDAAIATEHTNLDGATQLMAAATVDTGSRAAKVEAVRSRALDEVLRMREQLSNIEDVDPATAILTSQMQENAYQAALQVAAKILPMSLLDFMR